MLCLRFFVQITTPFTENKNRFFIDGDDMRFGILFLFFTAVLAAGLHASVYTVKDNDTLWGIAQKYSCSVNDIILLNEMVSDQIHKNQSLIIPDEIKKYKVQPGDNLIKIASQNNTKVGYIIVYNNLASEDLFLGQILLIPVIKKGTEAVSEPSGTILYYEIQQGDTLSHIAVKYNVAVADLLKWNDKPNENVYAGEKIKIFLPKNQPAEVKTPQPKPEPLLLIKHSVAENETLSHIALQYHVEIDDIVKWNKKKDTQVMSGEILAIYSKKQPGQSTKPNLQPPIPKSVTHTVKPGDTLTSISKLYTVSVEEIISLNKKPSYTIYIGEKLTLPDKAQKTDNKNIVKKTENWNNNQKSVILTIGSKPNSAQIKKPAGKPWDKSSVFAVQPGKITGVSVLERGVLIDLSAPQKIKNMGAGIVEFAGFVTGYNNIVIVKYPDNKRAVYGYLDEVYVKKNQAVKEGEFIGKVNVSKLTAKIQFYLELREGKQTLTVFNCFPFLAKYTYVAKK
ncbi:MAG: LysM peptidoglycan-binding domain-containing protein [Brevinematales bacterium]|nr:LysM peptidoglycan-binding domain-containing protein [Brevinematales bacterium]